MVVLESGIPAFTAKCVRIPFPSRFEISVRINVQSEDCCEGEVIERMFVHSGDVKLPDGRRTMGG